MKFDWKWFLIAAGVLVVGFLAYRKVQATRTAPATQNQEG